MYSLGKLCEKKAITGLKILRELKGVQCFDINEYPKRKKVSVLQELFQKIVMILL